MNPFENDEIMIKSEKKIKEKGNDEKKRNKPINENILNGFY